MSDENFTRFEASVNRTKKKQKVAETRRPSRQDEQREREKEIADAKRASLEKIAELKDTQSVAFSTSLLLKDVHVLPVAELRKRLKRMEDPADQIFLGRVNYIVVLAVDPGENYLEEFAKQQQERRHADFQKAIDSGLEQIVDFPDAREIVYWDGIYTHNTTAGKLRHMLETMEDPRQGFSPKDANDQPYSPEREAYPVFVNVSTLTPTEYHEKIQQQINDTRKRYLAQLEQYEDGQELWITYRNSHAFHPHKAVVGTLRANLWHMNEDSLHNFNHDGGWAVISDDPNFDIKKWEDQNLFHNRMGLEAVVGQVNDISAYRATLLSQLGETPDTATVNVRFTNDSTKIAASVAELKEFIHQLTSEQIQELGAPIFDVPGGKA